jgi:hypothetical protein
VASSRKTCSKSRIVRSPLRSAAFFYPDDEDIERVGVRGIYLSNYIYWNGRAQTEFIIDNLGFETAQSRARTFNIYDKLDDVHANGLHDYLKYLKFGYAAPQMTRRPKSGMAHESRTGHRTRDEARSVRPPDMDIFLRTPE